MIDFPAGAITCTCGRILSQGMKRCRGCGAARPVYGPVGASGRGADPKPPSSSPPKPNNPLTDFEKQSDKLRRAADTGLVSFKDRMTAKNKGTTDAKD